jgi:hypothetical protein
MERIDLTKTIKEARYILPEPDRRQTADLGHGSCNHDRYSLA